MMRTIYVVGGNGFIGKILLEHISKEKVSLISREMFKKIALNELNYSFNAADILIDLAWDYLDNFQSPLHLTEVLPLHIKFYDRVLEMGLKNISSLGTCLEYGVREGELEESAPSDPQITYAIAKDCLRRYLEYKKTKINFNFNWIRLFYIFGDGQPERTLYRQLKKAVEDNQEVFDMSSGLQKRDYLHVSVVAQKIAQVALSDKSCGIINCSSGNPITVLSFVNDRLHELGSSLKLNLGKYEIPKHEAFEFWGSVEKFNSLIESNLDQ